MKIKNIRASKEKKGFKKQIISFAFLGLSLILTSCKSSELQTQYDNLQDQYEDLQDQYEDLQRQYDDLAENFKIDRVEDRYYKNDLMAVVTNDKEGTPEYHFVKENIVDIDLRAGTNLSFKENVYVSITNDQLAYPNKCYRHDLVNSISSYVYNTIKESVRVNSCPFNGWIPDYNLQYYLVHDINNLPIPKEYKEKSYYSLEELKAIEEAMNNNSLDVIEQVNQKIEQNTFQKEGLYFVYCEDLNDGFLVDSKKYLEVIEASDPYDIYTFEYQDYYYSITDPTRGLKIDTNDPVFESEDKIADQIEFISLNENDLFVGKTCVIANIEDYKESYPTDELTYEEVVELENRIRTSLKDQTIKILKKK